MGSIMVLVYGIILHLVLCVIAGVLWRVGTFKTRAVVAPAVLLVPVCGFLLLLCEEYTERKKLAGHHDVGIDKLKINEVRFKHIDVEEEDKEEIAVPLEDAIVINEASVRRKLMLEILNKNPEEYIALLQRASLTDDAELTHYATTTMMEVQGGYEAKINDFKKLLAQNPEDIDTLIKYRRVLKKYIQSGLISGNILNIYRVQLGEVLEKLTAMRPEDRKYLYEKIDNKIESCDYSGLEEAFKKALNRWHQDEKVYELLIKYYSSIGRGDYIQRTIAYLEEKEIYFSSEGRKKLQFWKNAGGL